MGAEHNKNIVENIVEHLPSGVIYMDVEGKILLFNPGMEEITGINAREIVNKPVDAFIRRINLSGFDYKDVIKNAVVKKRINSFGVLPDGKEVYLGFTIAPVTDANNMVEGIIAIFADLTQIRKMEETQRRMAHFAMIGEMSARLAHEIKNPLASIIIGIQLFKKQNASVKNTQYLDMIISEIQRIDDLIKDLLVYSKKTVPHMTYVNVPAVVNNVLNIMEPTLQQYNIKVKKHVQEYNILGIIVDETAIHQALINILNNAIDAMPKGGTLTIDISSVNSSGRAGIEDNNKDICKYPEQELVKIDIEDTGIGIPETYIDNIFTPFFSTKAQGTGLGLSIVKNIIEENMGKIDVTSSKGKGTVFTLRFLKGKRKRCYEAIYCPENEKEKCEAYLKTDIYRCFRYRDLMIGCRNIVCTDCEIYTQGIINEYPYNR